jgi:hypothetical protein
MPSTQLCLRILGALPPRHVALRCGLDSLREREVLIRERALPEFQRALLHRRLHSIQRRNTTDQQAAYS